MNNNIKSIIPFRLNTLENSFYLYEIKQDEVSYCGFLGVIPINCIESGKVKGHENVLNKRTNEIIKQIKDSTLQNEPVLIMYEESQKLLDLIGYIKITFKRIEIYKDNLTSHAIWQISATEVVKNIIEEFSSMPNFTIADGHHRTCAVHSIYRDDKSLDKNNFGVLTFMLSQNQVKISSMNRILNINISHIDFIKFLEKHFLIISGCEAVFPICKQEIGLFINGIWNKLVYKFNDHVSYNMLEKIIRSECKNIIIKEKYFHESNIKIFENEVGDFIGVTFCSPTACEIIDIANKKEKLPYKSTWIEPKIPSGIITYSSGCSL